MEPFSIPAWRSSPDRIKPVSTIDELSVSSTFAGRMSDSRKAIYSSKPVGIAISMAIHKTQTNSGA